MPALAPELMPLTMSRGVSLQNSQHAQLHAVGRTAGDGPTPRPPVAGLFMHEERMAIRNREGHAALLRGGGHNLHVPQAAQFRIERTQAGGLNAVVV